MAAAIVVMQLLVLPAGAEEPSVDDLLVRLFAPKHKAPFELTADFAGALTLAFGRSRLTAEAVGSFKEWHRVGEPRRRKVTIHRLDLPLLLRPFAGALRSTIEQRVEMQSEDPETFHAHDFFILEVHPEGRYVLAGVRRDIVDDAFQRYGSGVDGQDLATRRAVARWLFTSTAMHSWIVRPGPPYALEATVDAAGFLYELTALYHWGQVGTRFAYTVVSGEPVWREVVSDVMTDPTGPSSFTGQLTLTFANHCINCDK